jgi:hypothetical protein
MVLIRDVTLTGKRPSIITGSEKKEKKMKEVYIPGVGMVPIEESDHKTVEVNININIVLSEKEEAEMNKMFDSK